MLMLSGHAHWIHALATHCLCPLPRQALDVMCGEFGMTGVLIATVDKAGTKKCALPKSCTDPRDGHPDGLMVQTQYTDQSRFFGYMKQSRFQFLPQIHDASPRVASQARQLRHLFFLG